MMVAFSVVMKSSVQFVSACTMITHRTHSFRSCITNLIAFEFPQINYKGFNGRRYNFAYGVAVENANLDVCYMIIIPDPYSNNCNAFG